ncbi:MAG: ribosome small subunit-dependent GTPase A [Bacillota bacterium]
MGTGILLKGYAGFYYVKTESEVLECSLRGRLRLKNQTFLAGDKVKVTSLGGGKGAIEEVLPRITELTRPPVANVDQVVVVMAMSSPPPDLMLMDRLLFGITYAGIKPIICWNKIDLWQGSPGVPWLPDIYAGIGYLSFPTSAKTGEGISQLREELKDRISVLAGPSGAGKSSLLNAVQPGLSLRTGQVSEKSQRGRHTTRHVELLCADLGGLVADTPGFSRLDLPPVKREEVAHYFPEMLDLLNGCRFSSCLHRQEPGCAVIQAVKDGRVPESRYQHYLEFLTEIIEKERRY